MKQSTTDDKDQFSLVDADTQETKYGPASLEDCLQALDQADEAARYGVQIPVLEVREETKK